MIFEVFNFATLEDRQLCGNLAAAAALNWTRHSDWSHRYFGSGELAPAGGVTAAAAGPALGLGAESARNFSRSARS